MLIHRTIELLLYPPGNLVLFVLLIFILQRYKTLTKVILGIAILQMLLFSLPVVSSRLMLTLENIHPPQSEIWLKQQLPEAIVVLGGGRNDEAYEYGGISPSSDELERLRYAAYLHNHTQVPILVSGGDPLRDGVSEASFMKQTLEQEFGVPVRWIEEKSHTTWQNAEFSDAILDKSGIKTAWVVTHAWHMPRSMMVFSNRSVKYSPASHSYGIKPLNKRWFNWIPQSRALNQSTIALHEYLGLIWYRLKQ